MFSRIRRTMLAAAVGVLGGAGLASADAPQALPGIGGVPAVAAPAPLLTAAPAAVAPGYAAPAPGYGAPGYAGAAPAYATPGYSSGAVSGGCSTCGGGGGYGYAGSAGGGGQRFLGRAAIGEGCANPVGCGNLASERTFLFGSCKQFFNPGNKCGGLFGGRCAAHPQGAGGIGDHNTCCYGSYQNR